MRVAANLLFEFRVSPRQRRRSLCESLVVVFDVRSAEDAVARARRVGRRKEHEYKNSLGGVVRYRFLGIIDLLEVSGDEAWYTLFVPKSPRRYLRRTRDLSVFAGPGPGVHPVPPSPVLPRQRRRKVRPA